MIKKIFKTILRDKSLSIFPKTSLIKKLSLLDMGARFGVGYPWNNAKIENLNVILVEPDPEEVELLSQHHKGWATVDSSNHLGSRKKSFFGFNHNFVIT
jgi:hypothetical protein